MSEASKAAFISYASPAFAGGFGEAMRSTYHE